MKESSTAATLPCNTLLGALLYSWRGGGERGKRGGANSGDLTLVPTPSLPSLTESGLFDCGPLGNQQLGRWGTSSLGKSTETGVRDPGPKRGERERKKVRVQHWYSAL